MSSIDDFLQDQVCKQTAVYWEYTGTDAYGNKTYADPVELAVRWDDTTELIRDDTGKEVASKAEVITLQDLKVDSWLYLGTLGELDSGEQDDPASVDGAYKIIRFDRNPGLASVTEFCRVAYL